MSKSLRSPLHRAVVTVIVASRREAKLTQEDLARHLGWHRSRIAKIESGERRIDVPEFIAIGQALGITPEQLLARVLGWLTPGVAPASLENRPSPEDTSTRAADDVRSRSAAEKQHRVKLLESLVKSLDPETPSP
jgi:transcriptional regulator with XRE-family HTH domain